MVPAEPGVGTVFNRVAVPKAEPWKAKRKLSDAQLLAHAEEAAGKMRQRKAEGKSEELGIEVRQRALLTPTPTPDPNPDPDH